MGGNYPRGSFAKGKLFSSNCRGVKNPGDNCTGGNFMGGGGGGNCPRGICPEGIVIEP